MPGTRGSSMDLSYAHYCSPLGSSSMEALSQPVSPQHPSRERCAGIIEPMLQTRRRRLGEALPYSCRTAGEG